ncbi:hypothetical protein H696_05399, partial [Fonticula alba]
MHVGVRRAPVPPPGLLVCLLLLVLGAAHHVVLGTGASTHLCMSPFLLFKDWRFHQAGPLGLAEPPATLLARFPIYPSSKVDVFSQLSMDFDAAPEFRLGPFFNPLYPQWNMEPFKSLENVNGTPMLIPSTTAGRDPALLVVGQTYVELLTESRSVLYSSPLRFLAGLAIGPDEVFLLLAIEDDSLTVVHLAAEPEDVSFEEVDLDGLTASQVEAVPAAATGSGLGFYVWQGRLLAHLEVTGDEVSVKRYSMGPDQAGIVKLFPGHLSSRAPGATGVDDLVLLRDDRTWEVYVGVVGSMLGTAALTPAASFAHPADATLQGRILGVSSTETPGPVRELYWLNAAEPEPGRPRLWRLELTATGQLGSLMPVLLPTSSAIQVGHFQPAMLRTGPSTMSLALVDNTRAYFSQEDFLCPVDRSIDCSPSSVLGWQCAPGHVLSPQDSHLRLCAACDRGFYLDPLAGPGGHMCSACAGDMCLSCKPGLLLQVLSPWKSACVETCPQDWVINGDFCLPEETWASPIHQSTLFPFTLGDSDPTQPMNILMPTTLSASLGGQPMLDMTIATGTPHSGYLSFSQGRTDALHLVHQTNQLSPLRSIRLPSSHPAADFQVDGALEFVLAPAQGLPLVGQAFCHGGGLSIVWATCSSPATQGQSRCDASFTKQDLSIGTCTGLHRVSDSAFAASLSSAGMVLVDMSLRPPTVHHLRLVQQDTRMAGFAWPGYQGRPRVAARMADFHAADQFPNLAVLAVDLLQSEDPRAEAALLGPVTQDPATNRLEPVVVPTPGRDSASELFLTGLTPGSALDEVVWRAVHIPIGGAPLHGRTSDLHGPALDLANLPSSVGWHKVLPLDLGLPGFPGGLVLVTPDAIWLSVLGCPPGARICVLRKPTKVTYDAPLSWPSNMGPIRLPGHLQPVTPLGGPLAGQTALEQVHLMLHAPGFTPTGLGLGMDRCPGGTFGPDCLPCAEVCATCTGPDPEDCTACWLALPDDPQGCVSTCPPGLRPDLALGLCQCQMDCAGCHLDPGGSGQFICHACPPGMALPVAQPLPSQCHACHSSCSECHLPGDPGACSACPEGKALHSGQCVPRCPAGMTADPAQRLCIPCPVPGCLRCGDTQWDVCDACQPGDFLDAGTNRCLSCDPSCVDCSGSAACTTCRSNLVFLATESSTPSLCGSTCAPGEYVGAGRCAACDGSCALCAQAADRCLVCAAGFRWSGPAPAAGATAACVPCDPGCASCRADGCLVCGAGLVLGPNGQCIADCPAGMFSNGESCQLCDVSCRTCAGGGADQCTGCGTGLELVEAAPGVGTCVSGCPAGQYRAGVECLPCDAACATCNGPTDKDCWQCAGA